jgi:tryptophan 2,3-dioxygenase
LGKAKIGHARTILPSPSLLHTYTEGVPDVSYSSYLKVDELLNLQVPLSDGPEHDELLFIVIHQSYELWFKSVLHELARTQQVIDSRDIHMALHLLGRVRTIVKALVAQVDILETMTPLQFNSFRDRLDSSSGFQSAQFRELEAVLGRRDSGVLNALVPGSDARARVEDSLNKPSLWDSVLDLLVHRGHLNASALKRDVTTQYEPSEVVQTAVVHAYRNDPELSLLLERLIDLDEGLQEWRYRHVKMVERTIGAKVGTGGSSGAQYLSSTLFKPSFADLWLARNSF